MWDLIPNKNHIYDFLLLNGTISGTPMGETWKRGRCMQSIEIVTHAYLKLLYTLENIARPAVGRSHVVLLYIYVDVPTELAYTAW
jgi:hypothetical protein